MICIAPWVNHDGGAIYSIDIHPTEDKLATSGQNEEGKAGCVVVWNLKPIKDGELAIDENVPKMLSKLDLPSGVNCVRWSVDGRMLACASDDRSIIIYEYDGRVKSSGQIGKKEKTIEKYKTAHTIHSHSMEVLAVAWSPDGKYLASCSMDDTIIIYNARKLPEKVAVLDGKRNGHIESVKGIAWDPIGKYLASQSSDRTVKIWTTDNWKLEQTISEPYKNCAQNTMFYRLAWSAEGQYLFTPGALNNDGPVAQIVRRKDWDISRDFVGYRKTVTCVSVCPRLLNYIDHSGANIRVSLVAIGSRDKSLSIFAYPLVKRPLCVITKIFKHSVMDISWRGLELAACSQDGSTRFLVFSEKDFGEVLSFTEMGSECEKHYKSCPSQFCSNESSSLDESQLDNTFIDTAEQLLAKRNAEANKSRLAPVVESQQQSAAAIEAKKKIEMLAETRKEQIVTRTIDGKQRIQPVFLASTIDDEIPVEPKAAEMSKPSSKVVVQPVVVKSVSAPSKKLGPRSPKKRKISTDDSTAESDSSDEDMDTSETETINTATTSEPKKIDGPTTSNQMMAADFKKPILRPCTLTRITVGEKETILDMPERRSNFTENVIGAPGESISVENEWKCVGVDASRICLMKGEVMVWAVLVDLPVATAAANKIITAVGCFDRSVRIFASSSGRLHCCLQLDSSPVRVGVNQGKVYALTQSGKFSSWDIEKRKSILSRVAVSDCVMKDDHLQSISITTAGLPILSFSNGDVFTYASDLQCWQLTDSPCSLMKLSRAVDSREIGEGQIGRALNRRRRFGPLPNTPILVRNSISETQLESWMNCAQSAGSSADFKKFLLSYVNLLLSNGSQTKLKELLARLEGTGGLCTIPKAALRREVEAILKENPTGTPFLSKKKTVI